MGYMSQDCTSKHLQMIKSITEASPYPNAEIHLTEWNSSPSPRDLIHDTPFMAPFILYNVTRGLKTVDSLGFWTFSDVFEENGPGNSQFHGGFGLINVLGIKKPSYYAYKFLSDMGNELVYKDDCCFATLKNGTLHILIWNYCYYTSEFSTGDRSKLSLHGRDDVFENKSMIFNIKIADAATITAFKLGKNHGSAFHNWVNSGAPESPSKEQIENLIDSSAPQEIKFNNTIELNANDVVYITATK